jgi:hypothetical protein
MHEGKIQISEWSGIEKRSIGDFLSNYIREHQRDPEAFPLENTLSEWQTQYAVWCGVRAELSAESAER